MKYKVSYEFEGEVFSDVYCANHLYLVRGDPGITVTDAPASDTCGECEMQDAAYESDKRAELRNEQVLSGVR